MATDNIYPLGINATTGKPERASTAYSGIAGDFVDVLSGTSGGNNQTIEQSVNSSVSLGIVNTNAGILGAASSTVTADSSSASLSAYSILHSSYPRASILALSSSTDNRISFSSTGPLSIYTSTGTQIKNYTLDGENPITISPTALAVNTDNYNPTSFAGAEVIRISASAPVNLTGLVAPATGSRMVTLLNVGVQTITLIDNATSTAANRFDLSANTPLYLLSSITLYYDATSLRWKSVGVNSDWVSLYGTVTYIAQNPSSAQIITRDDDSTNSLTITNPNAGGASGSSFAATSSVSSISMSSFTNGGYDTIESTVNGIQITAGSDLTFGVNGVTNNSGINTQGCRYDTPGTQAITAIGNTITPTATIMELSADGNYTLTSTPTIAAGADPGQLLILTYTGANTVTLQRESALAGSTLRLGAATRALSQYDTLALRWNGTYWLETSFTDNT